MRFTRHAKNRLRLIARGVPDATEQRVLDSLEAASEVGWDSRGNRLLAAWIDAILLIVVVDDARQIVITIWRKE